MKDFKTTVAALVNPLLYISGGCMAAGAVWIGLLSQWHVIWIGFPALFFSPFIIPILLIPAGIFSHFMALYQARGLRSRERAMFICSMGYLILFMTLWCAGIFGYVTLVIAPHAVVAGMLWGGGTAMVSILMWAIRDRGNILVAYLAEASAAALVVLSLLRLCGLGFSFWGNLAVFYALLAIAAFLQSHYEKKTV